MPAVKLSQNFISTLKPSKKRVNYSDTSNRYLMYRQGFNSGAFYHVRRIDGKLRYIKLDAVTYADAVRENARLTSGAVDFPAAADSDTLVAIHESFMKFKETRGDSAKCIRNARQRFRDYIPEALKRSSDVQTSDLEAVTQKLGRLGKCRTACTCEMPFSFKIAFKLLIFTSFFYLISEFYYSNLNIIYLTNRISQINFILFFDIFLKKYFFKVKV